MESIIGLIGVSGHYFTNFIDTLLDDSVHNFHALVGCVLEHELAAMGNIYIFSGGPGTGKTTIMNMLRKLFEDDGQVVFVDDVDPNKVQYDNRKTYFVATNLPPEKIMREHVTVIRMSGRRFPLKVYHQFMIDYKDFSSVYKFICRETWKQLGPHSRIIV